MLLAERYRIEDLLGSGGFQREIPWNVVVAANYTRRDTRRNIGPRNLAVPTSSYIPLTGDDPAWPPDQGRDEREFLETLSTAYFNRLPSPVT